MDPSMVINERVDVIARFDKSGAVFPARMRYRGQEVDFAKLGMRHPTARGQRMIHVFDVSDGVNDYRLEFDAESLTWVLVAMVSGGVS